MTTPRTTTITLPGGVRRTTTTRTVSVVLLPFIRSRKVYFKIEGLLPNMRHRPLFDDVDVSDWCREETFVRVSTTTSESTVDNTASLTAHPEGSASLISDAAGVIEGSFYIPNTSALRFRAGRREFKVRDWNATTDANSISKAFASYTAQGTLETQETSVTTIFPPPPPRPPVRRIDPVAQSFVIERPEGCFITSVDLFMQSKDSRVPLQVQIRGMQNGIPNGFPLPGARKFVAAADVNISDNPDKDTAGTITNVVFDAPIYLNGFTEYAVVLLAESDAYNVWTAVMTEFEVGSTTNRIMKQPSMGSFFKSQNGSTWTPDQSRDMMFRLKRAEFTPGSATAAFTSLDPLKGIVTAIETTNVDANPTLRVFCQDHGLVSGISQVTISGAVDVNGVAAASINATHTVVDGQDADSFTITITGDNSTAAGTVAQSNCFVDKDNRFNMLFANVNQMVLPQASSNWAAKTTTGRSLAGAETAYSKDASYGVIMPNENMEYPTPRLVAGATNKTANMSSASSLDLQATLSTSSKLISPVIDLSRLSASLIGNRIDRPAAASATGYNVPANYVAETDPIDGSAQAKHLTRAVTLDTAAVGLKVIFAANRPADSEIALYYRIAESGSDQPLSQTDWILATIDQQVQTDDDPNVFREYNYTIDGLDSFNTYQFKFVYTSTNSSSVPRVRDLRAIALGT